MNSFTFFRRVKSQDIKNSRNTRIKTAYISINLPCTVFFFGFFFKEKNSSVFIHMYKIFKIMQPMYSKENNTCIVKNFKATCTF